MKEAFKAYFSFTRTERLGLLGLLLVLAILIGIRITMHYFIKPATDDNENRKLQTAWEQFKTSHTVSDTSLSGGTQWYKNDNDSYHPASSVFNLNTIDSFNLVHLKGIGPVLAHKILEKRMKLGAFVSYDQLLEVHHFPEVTFNMLKQHLIIKKLH
ncbi:MAG TPA: helix-hairpin-helix domain-containing protein [Flavipsychrobacter sp.]|nr:helix-hairpin-helix domain-containing protein [Flavipsychrobacter sp.]